MGEAERVAGEGEVRRRARRLRSRAECGSDFSCRNMSKEQSRDYRDKERDRNREDRFSRSCKRRDVASESFRR